MHLVVTYVIPTILQAKVDNLENDNHNGQVNFTANCSDESISNQQFNSSFNSHPTVPSTIAVK